ESMIPLYNYDPKEFWEYYDIAVNRGIVAFFVNSRMKIKEISEEVIRRVSSAKAYGYPSIHIHGIGNKNIEKINKCLDGIKDDLKFTAKNVFKDKTLGVVVVEIIL